MKFLCDVHISFRLKNHLIELGFEALHINEVLDRWHTKDPDICAFADAHDLIVITKDADFRNSHLINQTPAKLIKVNLGNVSNSLLIEAFSQHINDIKKLDKHQGFLIELDAEHTAWMIMNS